MRKYLSCVFLFICFTCEDSFSQDLIVTKVGDSLACRIVKQTEEYVHFSYTKYNYNTVRELKMSRVASIVPGFYQKKDSLRAIANQSVMSPNSLLPIRLFLPNNPAAALPPPIRVLL